MPLQIRRGTNAERIAMSVPLAQGELLYVTDDQRLYIGNGTTLGGVQITGFTNEDAQDAAASMFTSGTHNGISFTYGVTQDGLNRIDATVDLSGYTGIIAADAFKGSIFGDDSGILVDGLANKINLDGTVKGNIVPDANGAYDLGTTGSRFRDLYSTGSVHIGTASITNPSAGIVNLPAGSTIDGVVINSGGGGGGLANVVDDTTPQLGGDLDLNSNDITGTGNINISGTVTATSISTSLGSDLGLNSNDITGVGNINITGTVTATNISGAISGSLGGYLDLGGYGVQGSGVISVTSDAVVRGITGFRGVDSNNPFSTHFRRSRGTTAAPTTLLNNDQISATLSEGYDGTNYVAATSIISRTVGTISTGAVPGQLEFYTADFLGNLTRRMAMDHTGLITASANVRIDSTSYSSSTSPLAVRQFHDTADANNINFSRARGTLAVPTSVVNGDDLCDIGFSAFDGSTYVACGGLSSTIDGVVSTGSVPTKLTLSVNSGSGVVERVSVASNGVITFTVPELTAGQVNTSSVATYWKVNINGTEYAIPAYALV